jgi:hypothetical protein
VLIDVDAKQNKALLESLGSGNVSLLSLLHRTVSIRHLDDIALESFVLQQPRVDGQQYLSSDLRHFHAFCSIRLVDDALVLWRGNPDGRFSEMQRTAISMAMDQAKTHLHKIDSTDLQIDVLSCIFSLLLEGDTKQHTPADVRSSFFDA